MVGVKFEMGSKSFSILLNIGNILVVVLNGTVKTSGSI
jgi:hypothetical protein